LWLSFVSLPVLAQNVLFPNEDYTKRCSVPAHGSNYLVINANTGEVMDGHTQFPAGATVQVIYFKPNPFRYTYSFSRSFQSLDEKQTYDFFRLIPGFSPVLDNLSGLDRAALTACGGDVQQSVQLTAVEGAKATTDGALVSFSESMAGKEIAIENKRYKISKVVSPMEISIEPPYTGPRLTDVFATIITSAAGDKMLRDELDDLKRQLGSLPQEFDHARKQYTELQKTLTERQTLECSSILPRMNQVLFSMKSAPKMADTVAGLAKKVTDLRERVAKHTFVSDQCGAEMKKEIAAMLDGEKGLLAAVEANRKAVEELNAAFTGLRDAFSNSSLFYHQTRFTQKRSGVETLRSRVAKVNEADTAAPPAPADVSVEIGDSEALIRLSAGIGFSTVPDRRIVREPGKDGAQDVTKFGYETNSNFKPSGIVMISALPIGFTRNEVRWADLGLSAGLVLSDRGASTQAEYILGPTLGFLGQRAFLTLGLHAAKVESFPRDFKEGDIVPSSLPDPLPVRRNWKHGLMVSLTYRLR
jgi:hypothetical protein